MKGMQWLAAGALIAAPAFSNADDFSWSGRLGAGQTLEVKGVNGSIVAEAASGAEAEVTAEKRGRRSDPESVEVKVVEHAAGVTICAVYPSRMWSKPNECGPGEGGMNSHNNDVQVHFRVRVPAGVRFTARTVNGDVEAAGLGAEVIASTVNGQIRIATSGEARATTVNGSIEARLGRADGKQPLQFETVNGGITLDLPAGLSADVHASTVNGSIETDFPLSVTGKFSRRRLDGSIGGGGRDLRLETVNGSIRLRQAR